MSEGGTVCDASSEFSALSYFVHYGVWPDNYHKGGATGGKLGGWRGHPHHGWNGPGWSDGEGRQIAIPNSPKLVVQAVLRFAANAPPAVPAVVMFSSLAWDIGRRQTVSKVRNQSAAAWAAEYDGHYATLIGEVMRVVSPHSATLSFALATSYASYQCPDTAGAILEQMDVANRMMCKVWPPSLVDPAAATVRRAADLHRLPLIDLRHVFELFGTVRVANPRSGNRGSALLGADQLHPNQAGADLIWASLCTVVKQQSAGRHSASPASSRGLSRMRCGLAEAISKAEATCRKAGRTDRTQRASVPILDRVRAIIASAVIAT